MQDPQEGYLLDTNVASLATDGGRPEHTGIRQRIANLATDLVYVSVITLAEVDYGLKTATAVKPARHQEMRQALNEYEIKGIDRHTSEIYGSIRAELFNRYAPRTSRGRVRSKYVIDLVDKTTDKKLGIQENDLWLVSIAVQYNLVLVTGDKKIQRVIGSANYSARTEYWN